MLVMNITFIFSILNMFLVLGKVFIDSYCFDTSWISGI